MFIMKYYDKIIWSLNHFLTMEFYRKLCNKLYWKKLKPGTASFITRFCLILFSAISLIWLAFFFDPMDPYYTKSPSGIILRLNKIFKKFSYFIVDLFHSFSLLFSNLLIISPLIPDSNNITLCQTNRAYLKKSSFLI